MKKIVLVFGLAAGLIVSSWMLASVVMCANGKMDMTLGMVFGYSMMLIAFSLIFVAVKKYRDNHNGGFISFGKAFRIGLLIALIASTFYVVAWLIEYYFFFPDFTQQYSASMMAKEKAGGATATELAKKAEEMAEFNEMYKNPLFVILMTYIEVLPVGLLVSLIAALILKRKKNSLEIQGLEV